ncbi:hypothetical protein RB195_013564 [Necator americanus]|uniref:Uncharacterized protein n=1 Tax=Necator americanus TaxID=51031 RepID=A0ABR1DW35_NECAM
MPRLAGSKYFIHEAEESLQYVERKFTGGRKSRRTREDGGKTVTSCDSSSYHGRFAISLFVSEFHHILYACK